MRAAAALLTVVFGGSIAARAQPAPCPHPGADGSILFADGSISMRTPLAVNPDGAAASYTPGDHGYTYISNGVNLNDHGTKVSCSASGNAGRCRTEWARAEAGDFGAGTPEFCVFAMEVESVSGDASLVPCAGEKGQFIVGNAKGRPKLAEAVPSVSGQAVTPYLSTTFLRHTRNGRESYVDSAAIPALVVPTSRPELVGAIAWVRFGDNSVFAIVNDTGPAFGEGSVALHQALRTGRIGPTQPVGPIPQNLRCSQSELSLRPPFQSRPDLSGDGCGSGNAARGASDIRAYSGIDGRVVDSVILAGVKPPMQGTRVAQELTPALLESVAAAAGYSRDKVAAMASCLR